MDRVYDEASALGFVRLDRLPLVLSPMNRHRARIRPFYVELFDTGQTVVPRRTDIRAFRNLVPVAENPPFVLLWKTDTISCTCLSHTAERVEVRFSVKDVVIERKYFTDREAATQFALDKMHAYNAQ